MELFLLLLPIIGIAAVMTLLARLPGSSFVIGSVIVIISLLVFALFQPELATFNAGPKMASGFSSWAFPAAATVLSLALSIWRRLSRPGVVAFFACVPISGIVHYMGAWSA